MIAVRERAEQHFVLHSVSWDGYETLLREIGDRHLRMTYDNGDLEFMTLSLGHENAGEWIGRLIFFLAVQWRVPIFSGGSTTLKKAIRNFVVDEYRRRTRQTKGPGEHEVTPDGLEGAQRRPKKTPA